MKVNVNISPSPPVSNVLFLLSAGVLFGLTVIRSSWLCDDAYISFRVVDNFIQGYGLTWNPAERVQAYTHPLWLFLLSGLYWVFHDLYYTTIFFSLLLSLGAVWIFSSKIARSIPLAILGILTLMGSKAFMDYSTSGLENPLSHFLLVGFYSIYLRFGTGSKPVFLMALAASLGLMTRMDLFFLFLFPLMHCLEQNYRFKTLLVMGLGLSPFLLWETFSLFYYGFPFPNPAYAKLITGLPRLELIRQGLHYFGNSFRLDPLTLIIITGGLVSSFLTREKWVLRISFGVLGYIFYVIWIGGDFMSGRFLTSPLLLSVILLSRLPLNRFSWKWGGLAVIILGLSLVSPFNPLVAGSDYGVDRQRLIDSRGIADERGFYFPNTGLLSQMGHKKERPDHFMVEKGRAFRGKGPLVMTWGESGHGFAGFFGYYAGPKVHIIDSLGITDPLLSKLPPFENPYWRIGHLERFVPEGYVATRMIGKNRIKDKHLAVYYDKIALITQGELFNGNRIREVLKLNMGSYDHWIDYKFYRFPFPSKVRWIQVQASKPEGTPWNATGNTQISYRGLQIDLEGLCQASRIKISLDNNDYYVLLYLKGERLLAKQPIPPRSMPGGGLAVHHLEVPSEAYRRGGYDRLKIIPVSGDGRFSLGHLKLLD
jgi:arabinofuranosyltransferase